MRQAEQQKKIRNQAGRSLKKAEAVLEAETNRRMKNEFLERFMLCELACKKIITGYNEHKHRAVVERDIKLQLPTIQAALKYAGYPRYQGRVEQVFGSGDKRGSKTCKKLRDGIVHSMSAGDIREVASRYRELMEDMGSFLALIRTNSGGKRGKKAEKRRMKNAA